MLFRQYCEAFYVCRILFILNHIAETTVIMQGCYIKYFIPPSAEPFHLYVKQGQKIIAVEV